MIDQPFAGSGVSGEELPAEPLDPIMLAEVLEALAGRLESLEGLVEAMRDQLVDAPAGGPWAWSHLGRSQTRALFLELRDWVDWLITRYELRGEAETIPPCWFLHPVAVEEHRPDGRVEGRLLAEADCAFGFTGQLARPMVVAYRSPAQRPAARVEQMHRRNSHPIAAGAPTH
jgi:hypothetical protein